MIIVHVSQRCTAYKVFVCITILLLLRGQVTHCYCQKVPHLTYIRKPCKIFEINWKPKILKVCLNVQQKKKQTTVYLIQLYITAELAIHIEICSLKKKKIQILAQCFIHHHAYSLFHALWEFSLTQLWVALDYFYLQPYRRTEGGLKKYLSSCNGSTVLPKCFFLHHMWTHFCAIHHIM